MKILIVLLYQEPKEFLVAYEEMVSWATDGANWATIESELSSKGVKVGSMFLITIDNIAKLVVGSI